VGVGIARKVPRVLTSAVLAIADIVSGTLLRAIVLREITDRRHWIGRRRAVRLVCIWNLTSCAKRRLTPGRWYSFIDHGLDASVARFRVFATKRSCDHRDPSTCRLHHENFSSEVVVRPGTQYAIEICLPQGFPARRTRVFRLCRMAGAFIARGEEIYSVVRSTGKTVGAYRRTILDL
jgi:hypothetical protein